MSNVIHVDLLAHSEKVASDNPFGSAVSGDLLYHQWRTYQALQSHSLVVNTYNTGTGKTRAALLHLLDPARHGVNMLFIAPTNELIAQHTRDVKAFCERAGLDYNVIHVDAKELRALDSPHDHERVGARLVRLIHNPQEYGWDGRKPLIVVTNPDIFYYATYFAAYNHHDRRNLFEQFMLKFDYVVIDEFHYYNPKQLTAFLFYFSVCKEFGYFAKGRRICLLSATPELEVLAYLAKIFVPHEIAFVRPINEPHESAHLATKPALAPLRLEIRRGLLEEHVNTATNRTTLIEWLKHDHLDGAIISSALWRVNVAHAALQSELGGMMARITGAEQRDQRRAAPQYPLVLATPTVDIGYNFDKPAKTRQPLDFVIFDARTRDQFLQRLGRAGRVLGKTQTDSPARAIAILDVDDSIWNELKKLDDQTLDRLTFSRVIHQHIPARGDLYSYMRAYGMKETLRPMYAIQQTLRPDLHDWLRKLFDGVREVFAPGNARWSYDNIRRVMSHLEAMERVVKLKDGRGLCAFLDDCVQWKKWDVSPDQFAQLARKCAAGDVRVRDTVRGWVEEQYSLESAIFNFRESLQTPEACVFDPHHLLAESNVTVYDAVHIVKNFNVEWFDGKQDFESKMRCAVDKAQAYGRVQSHRSPRLKLRFDYSSPDHIDRESFENVYCRRPVALKGLRVRAEEIGVKNVLVQLHPAITQLFEGVYIPLLLVRQGTLESGVLNARLRGTSLFVESLRVFFADDSQVDYAAVMGSAAFSAHAELEGFFFVQSRKNELKAYIT